MNTQLFLQQAYELVKDEENITANLANMSAFLMKSFQILIG